MIKFSRKLYDCVIKQAYNGEEEEIVGILGGEYEDDQSIVKSVYAAENAANTPETRYFIDPEEQFELLETVEDAGEEVIGFYHSHPVGPTHPSEIDTEWAAWPDKSYVIVALDGYPYVGSWRWREEDGFAQELLQVLADPDDY